MQVRSDEYVEPRIGSSYQALNLPQPSTAPASDLVRARCIHSSNESTANANSTDEMNQYLNYCKRLTLENDGQFYSEDDEVLLRHLYEKANGNVQLAQFLLLNKLASGESSTHRSFYKYLNRRAIQRLNRMTQQQQQRRRGRAHENKVSWDCLYDRKDVNVFLMGDLRQDANNSTCNKYGYTDLIAFTRRKGLHRVHHRSSNEIGKNGAGMIITDRFGGAKDIAMMMMTMDHRGHADRSEMKVRWRQLMAHAEKMIVGCFDADEVKKKGKFQKKNDRDHLQSEERPRPNMRDVLDLLSVAHAMPMPLENPGEGFIEKTVSTLNQLLKFVSLGRDCLSNLHDSVYCHNKHDGIDLEHVKKALKRAKKTPLKLEEADIVQEVVNRASEWEKRLDQLMCNSALVLTDAATVENKGNRRKDFIAEAMTLVDEAESLTPLDNLKSKIALEKRIKRAITTRERILAWDNEECNVDDKNIDLKNVVSWVNEINRIGLYFPEVNRLITIRNSAEIWMEKVAAVNRTDAHLSDIETLICEGIEMPINVSDFLTGLDEKAEKAHQWLDEFRACFPDSIAIKDESKLSPPEYLEIMSLIRHELGKSDKRRNEILGLKLSGAVVPLKMDLMEVLTMEVEAYKWSAEAEKMLFDSESKKIGLTYAREHIKNATVLRGMLPFDFRGKKNWFLRCEKKLMDILLLADRWLERYCQYFEQQKKRKITLGQLRKFVEDAGNMPIMVGDEFLHSKKVLKQCEEWVSQHSIILKHCEISFPETNHLTNKVTTPMLSIQTIDEAVSQSLNVDLDELSKLKSISNKIHKWLRRSSNVLSCNDCVKGEGVSVDDEKEDHLKLSLEEIIQLIQDSQKFPVNLSKESQLLQHHIDQVKSWIASTRNRLRLISFDLNKEQQRRRKEVFKSWIGEDPSDYLAEEGGHSHNTRKRVVSGTFVTFSEADIPFRRVDLFLSCRIQHNDIPPGFKNTIGENVKQLRIESQNINVFTIEEEVIADLVKIWSWYERVSIVIANPNDVISDPFSTELETLMQEGIELCAKGDPDEEDELFRNVMNSWVGLLLAEGFRLDRLWRCRNDYQGWREKVEGFVFSSDKLSLTTLEILKKQCSSFPSGIEFVKLFMDEVALASDWFEETQQILDKAEKVTIVKMKSLIVRGEKVKITANDELKVLKQHLKQSRSWSARAKKIKADEDHSRSLEVKVLMDEYSNLLIELPDEIAALKKATSCYCLCREYHSTGLMVACDECGEWYHGNCIGVTQSQANRCEKYKCVRCLLTKGMQSISQLAISKIQKWTDYAELIKARQVEGQKHQRKVRREKKEIEMRTLEVEVAEENLAHLDSSLSKFNMQIDEEAGNRREQALNNDGFVRSSTCQAQLGDKILNLKIQKATLDSEGKESKLFPIKPNISSEYHHQQGEHGSRSIDMSEETSIPILPYRQSMKSHKDEITSLNEDLLNDKIRVRKLENEKLQRAKGFILGCSERLAALQQSAHERKDREEKENAMSSVLCTWLTKVYRNVFRPESEEMKQLSRPLPKGRLSNIMKDLLEEADQLGLSSFPDVQIVKRSFYCNAWFLHAHFILARKPKIDEISKLLEISAGIKLPDERAVKILRHILNRAKIWQSKAQSALAPRADSKKPFDVALLTKLFKEVRNFPVIMIEESRLWNTIDDDGVRHCLCGGPGDGSFMLACDKCERWYHGRCVGLSKSVGEELTKWHCPRCNENYGDITILDSEESIPDPIRVPSPNAPSKESLWPPIEYSKLPAIDSSKFINFENDGHKRNGNEHKKVTGKRPVEAISQEKKEAKQKLPTAVASASTTSIPHRVPEAAVRQVIRAPGPAHPHNLHTFPLPQAAPYSTNLLNTGMMAPEASMMLSGTIAALSAQALLANSTLFPTNPNTSNHNINLQHDGGLQQQQQPNSLSVNMKHMRVPLYESRHVTDRYQANSIREDNANLTKTSHPIQPPNKRPRPDC